MIIVQINNKSSDRWFLNGILSFELMQIYILPAGFALKFSWQKSRRDICRFLVEFSMTCDFFIEYFLE